MSELMPMLIRKKSGDIVKSSLKLNYLNQSLSSPNLKTVRFATALTNIKMFDGTASPSNILSPSEHASSGYFDWNYGDSDEELENDFFESGHKVGGYYNSDDFLDVGYNASGYDSRTGSFDKPFGNDFELSFLNILRPHQYFYRQKKSAPVQVHSIQLQNGTLSGLINVQNLAYEKIIIIKLSINNWNDICIFSNRSSTIQFFKSIDHSLDQFKFNINLTELLQNYPDTQASGRPIIKLNLCCQYEVNNKIFYDNNNDSNYQVLIKNNKMDTLNGFNSRPELNKSFSVDSFKQSSKSGFNKSHFLKSTTPTTSTSFNSKSNLNTPPTFNSKSYSHNSNTIKIYNYNDQILEKQVPVATLPSIKISGSEDTSSGKISNNSGSSTVNNSLKLSNYGSFDSPSNIDNQSNSSSATLIQDTNPNLVRSFTQDTASSLSSTFVQDTNSANSSPFNSNNQGSLNSPNKASRIFNNIPEFRPKLIKSYSTSHLERPKYSNSYKLRMKSNLNSTPPIIAPFETIPSAPLVDLTESIEKQIDNQEKINYEQHSIDLSKKLENLKLENAESIRKFEQPVDLSMTKINSASYSDIINNFCFGGSVSHSSSNSSISSRESERSNNSLHSSKSSQSLLTPTHCSIPSTASTLHSFSDSIHT